MSAAVVIGAAGGIGKAICQALIKDGHEVMGCDNDTNPPSVGWLVTDHLILSNGVTEQSWDETIHNNLTVSYRWASSSVASSSITFIGSLATVLGFPNNPSYQASKAGLLGLMRALAYDLGPKGVRVNVVSPGYVRAPMTAKSYEDEERRRFIASHTMLRRWGTADEIANVVAFLCSDKASYITGQNIVVDGGWSARGEMCA